MVLPHGRSGRVGGPPGSGRGQERVGKGRHLSLPRPVPSAAAPRGSGLGSARSPPPAAGCSGPALGTARCPGQKDQGQPAARAECRAEVSRHRRRGSGGTACGQSGLGSGAAELTSRPWGRREASRFEVWTQSGHAVPGGGLWGQGDLRDCPLARTWLSGVGPAPWGWLWREGGPEVSGVCGGPRASAGGPSVFPTAPPTWHAGRRHLAVGGSTCGQLLGSLVPHVRGRW